MYLFLAKEEDTLKLGNSIGELIGPGNVLVLSGDLGAGKTTLTKGIAAALGVGEPVTSPTFSLLNIYNGRYDIAHIDAYRLNNAQEGFDAGLEEYLPGDCVTVVEWPDNIAGLLPQERLAIKISRVEDGRAVEIIPYGSAYTKLLKELEENWT
ncbi:tRNA (adenosine(37)-N6)-threonylcarbamoyltransferase complex ATPase subunit type 1 TsaE [Metallumcola ferriviriculae]|uniref:tRNA threonylcarbamoyladenosine biosynthesis protein TsaE n=1 Tax=Metallumcola ferriviriculae TaxID=3039180 RepID=A0AAU0UW23_9FIRM|nr:tRNA (adenosine(37)-N6)-threonylcarbamoyltransferase complex ATPase subunit type 1 TsaE [Desulfitibacteraceae bacterium MK1]